MSEFPAHDRAELTVRLDTGRAVEVSDLGRSLQALGKQYEEFVVAHGVKLLFLTPEAKAAILDKPENPFQWAYVIDGEVSTVEGEPALYKIAAVHEAIERS